MLLQIIHVSKRTKRCLEFIVVERVLPLLNNEKKKTTTKVDPRLREVTAILVSLPKNVLLIFEQYYIKDFLSDYA